MPPHFGHGPAVHPEKEILKLFSKENPDEKAVPQESQKAGIAGIGAFVMANVMHTAEPAVYKWRCGLHWTSKTPEVGLQTRAQADGLEIYTGIKI
jgi:hypothetical protein